MNLLKTLVEIGVDDQASNQINSLSTSVKSKLVNAGKVAVAAVGAAVTGFIASSVQAGAEFDTQMSQVAATMGTTTDEIQDLRDFALEMGSTTAFSASQAAEALNYMALAGYDSTQSMEMLPTVLNLAAAGGIELADASDMVTDAQSALGLSMDETTEMVDKMAKTSSKSNTSVAQLGEAILTVGGTAKNLAGGTTELNQVLGILADNGIKASEGGTHLRNIMLAMTPTTDAAVAAFDELGVSTYDADGNLRPLQDTFLDLQSALADYSDEEQQYYLTSIFNKTDLSSVNALLGTTADRWDELADSIDDAQGAAEEMANTQLDNLTGSVTIFKSALEGAQIALSDKLSPYLKNFVDFATEKMGQFTDWLDTVDIDAIIDNVTSKLEALFNIMQSLMPLTAGIVAGFAAFTVVSNIITTLNTFKTALTEIKKVMTLAQAAQALFNSTMLANPVVLVVTAIVALIAILGTFLLTNEDARNTLASVWETIKSTVGGVVDALAKFFTQTVPNALAKMINWFATLPTKIAGFLANVILKVASWATQMTAKAVSTGMNFLSSLVKFIGQIPGKLASLLAQGLSNVISWARNLVNNVRNAGSNALSALRNSFSGVASIGKNLIQGLWNGISDMAGWIKSKIQGFGEGVLNSLKNFFGIHSPSTVMRDQIGKFLGMGIGEGIPLGFDIADPVEEIDNKLKTLTADSYDISATAESEYTLNAILDKLDEVKNSLPDSLKVNKREFARLVNAV
jgi:TP901 family phage tail tape measure protein